MSAEFLPVFLYMALLFGCSSNAQENNKPNIVLIYTDDLGYGDIRCT